MNRRILTIVGALSLLVWTVGGLVAWGLTKEGVSVTVREGSARDAADDGLHLLEDRVGALENDLRALASTLETNFSVLQANEKQDLGARAAEIEAHVEARLGQSVAALQTSLGADRQERREQVEAATARADETASRLLAALHEVEAARRRETPSVVATAAREAPRADAPAPSATQEAPVVAASPPPAALPPRPAATPAPLPPPAVAPVAGAPGPASPPALAAARSARAPTPAATPAAPEPPAHGFLSFQLPSDAVRFDRRQRFTVVPSLSRVGFDGSSTLHGFTGVTSTLTGTVEVDLSHADRDPRAEIHVDAATLDTGEASRDAEMRTSLGTAQQPEMTFRLLSFRPERVDARAERVVGVTHGQMTIHGVTREVDMPTSLSLDASRRLHVDGEMPLDMTAYGVTPPSKLGVINVDRMVKVWIRLRARIQAGS